MKVCFIGAGSIGKRHIRNLKYLSEEEGFSLEIHLLRSSQRQLDEDICGLITKEWCSLDDIQEVFDAVFVTNPTYLHYETMLKWKNKARFFFIEKPVFEDWNKDLSPFAQMKENVYYVACPLRYTKVLQRAKQIVKANQVFSIRAICSSYLPDWRDGIDYRSTYSANKRQGGGVKIDLIHEWDYLIDLFGIPEQIYHFDGAYSKLEIDSEDIAIYIAKYKDKLLELHLDYFGRNTQRYCEIMTQDAVYKFDIANSCIYKNGRLFEEYKELPNEKYVNELRFFNHLMESKAVNYNDIQHAINTMKIACGIV